MNLVERCRDFGGEFGCFVPQGSCDGENERQYDSWVVPAELSLIPPCYRIYLEAFRQIES